MDLTLYLVVALTVVLIPYTTCSSYGKLGGDCNGAYVCRRPVRRPGIPYKRVCVRRNNLCDGVKQCPRGDDERRCTPEIVCPLLDWPANGYVKHDGVQPEDTAIYSCATGFELSGNASRTCLQTGSWEGSVPTCSPIDCGSLPEATGGSFVLTGNSTYGAVALYTCNTNYSVCGDITPGYTRCNELGQWTEDYAICARTDCYVMGKANEYCGKENINYYDELCENWNLYIDENTKFPEGSAAAASNYCRAPEDDRTEPWCFTSYGDILFYNVCGVPVCA